LIIRRIHNFQIIFIVSVKSIVVVVVVVVVVTIDVVGAVWDIDAVIDKIIIKNLIAITIADFITIFNASVIDVGRVNGIIIESAIVIINVIIVIVSFSCSVLIRMKGTILSVE
jgi:hypothetical protein